MRRNFKIIALFITTFIIFGANTYSTLGYTVKKSNFSNVIICIDPGHQTKGNSETESIAPGSKIKKAKVTSGTTGIFTRVPEYKFNLKLSLKIEDLLKKAGFKVIMTRNTNDVDLSNIERAEIANKSKANLFLRIHADGSNDKNIHGISILYPDNKNNKDIYSASKSAAAIVLSSVINKTSAKSDGIVQRSDMTGFNWCKVPSILIEAGFMTNIDEDKKLEDNDYENSIAEGIVNGIETNFSKK
jgi:N-acetylmuramoyl-L-alanine amidase